MICNNCKNQLPDGSQSCPYCKASFAPVAENITPRSCKKNPAMIILVSVAAGLLVITAILIIVTGGKSSNKNSAPAADTAQSVSDSTVPSAPSTTPATQAPSTTAASTTTTTAKATTKKTTKKTTVKTTKNNKPGRNDILDGYVEELTHYSPQYMFSEYYVYDINKDGICELIISYGTCEADRVFMFFTYTDRGSTFLFTEGASHSALYIPRSGSGVIKFGGHMGNYEVSRLTLSGRSISSQSLDSGYISEDGSYYDIESKYCGDMLPSSSVGDISLLEQKIR